MPVYAFRKTGTNQVKIGVSTNVQKRLRVLQHSGGNHLQEIFSVDSASPYVVERALHVHYSGVRSRIGDSEFREWFDISTLQEAQLIEEMQRLADESPKALRSGLPLKEDEFAWLREPMAEAFAAGTYTEKDLAGWAHVPVSYVHSILEGRVRLTYPRVQKIAEKLNIELVAVITDSREIVIPDEPEFTELDDMFQALARIPYKPE